MDLNEGGNKKFDDFLGFPDGEDPFHLQGDGLFSTPNKKQGVLAPYKPDKSANPLPSGHSFLKDKSNIPRAAVSKNYFGRYPPQNIVYIEPPSVEETEKFIEEINDKVCPKVLSELIGNNNRNNP